MRPGYDEVVLLTGFPGFHARKMCEEILRDPKTFVYLTVPPHLEAEAREVLEAFSPSERARVEPLEGDTTAMDLGLSGREFKTVTSEVDRIHHLARITDRSAERKLVERVNLGGAREILTFASSCKNLACLVFHSTALVAGDRKGLVVEQDLAKGQDFRSVIEETFARSEKRMRAAMPKIPIAVVRPTVVVGDSRTGEIDTFDGFYFLVLLILTSPPDFPLHLPSRADVPLHLVPIDYVVRAARAIGRDPRAPGRTFHIGDPSPFTAKRIADLVSAASGRRVPRGFMPANLTKALLRTPGIDRLAKSPRSFLESLATPISYSFANTTEILEGTDVRCPPFDTYVDKLVEYVQQRLREKRTRAAEELRDPLAGESGP